MRDIRANSFKSSLTNFSVIQCIPTVTFEEQSYKTLVLGSERHPTKESLDEALVTSLADGTTEQFNQLEEFVATLQTETR